MRAGPVSFRSVANVSCTLHCCVLLHRLPIVWRLLLHQCLLKRRLLPKRGLLLLHLMRS